MAVKPGLYSRLRAELIIFIDEYHEMDSIRNPLLRNILRIIYLLLFPLYFVLALLVNPLLAKGLDWITSRSIDTTYQDVAGDCQQYRDQHILQPENVPPKLQDLLPLAQQFGLGDGECREYFLTHATPVELEQLQSVTGKAEEISIWLQSFAEGEMSDEAAAFLYLLHAEEELNLRARHENDSSD